jgi:hypothetical protein
VYFSNVFVKGRLKLGSQHRKTRLSELLIRIVASFLHAQQKGTANATLRSFRELLKLVNF